MFKKTTVLVASVVLCCATRLFAQTTPSATLWIQYMQEPNPNYYKVKKAFYDYWKDTLPDGEEDGYHLFKRWEWRVKEHLDANGYVVWPMGPLNDLVNPSSGGPTGGGANSGASGGGGSPGASSCPANGRWTAVGPFVNPWNQTSQPTGIGRVAGICFDPKDSTKFYLCSPQGGVWKTTNSGSTWSQIFGTGPLVNTIGATSMVISYNNTDTMYVGTGDRDASDAPGYGVIASWDGGKTWVTRNSGISSLYVGRMVMDPRNSKILIIATNNGIYRSTDGGSSWSGRITGAGAWDVAFHPKNPSIVYCSIGGYFYRSTDNGVSWTQITSGLPSSSYRGMIAVTPADRGYVYFLTTASTTFQGLYRSTDSGQNFSNMSTTPNIFGYSQTGADASGQGWYDMDIAADPNNKNTIYSATINIWKSTDGGSTWAISSHWLGNTADDVHSDHHCIEFNITSKKIYAGNDGGIYYTANAGTTWNNISSGIQSSQIYRIAAAKTDAFLSAQGYQDNGSAQTTNDAFYTYDGGDGLDCQVDPTDAKYVYGSYVYGSIYRAIDKTSVVTLGANGTNGITESGAWLTPFVLQEGTPARMFAGYINIWRCDNVKTSGTPSWTKISSSLAGTNTSTMRFLENSPAQSKMFYALRSDGKLFRTSDATVTTPNWVDISSGLPSNARWLEAHPKDSNIVYLCAGTDIYKSRNRGSTWTSITSGLSSVGQIECMILDTSGKNDAMYIGTEKGVYYRDTAISSWITYSTNFPVWADVTDIDIYYSPKGSGYSKLIASTYGRGVWRTNLYEDGTTAPVAGFYAFDSVFVTGGKMKLYEQIKNSISSLTWKITPYSYTYTDGTDSTSNNPIIKFNAAGTYTVKLTATNCQGSNTYTKSSWVKVYTKAATPTCYNTTTYQTYSYGIGIMRFTLSDNTSETGGYFDDGANLDMSSDKIFRIKPSTSYNLTVKTGLYNSEYFRVFIDYNNNGKFENYKGEAVVNGASALGSRTLSFTTPSTMVANTGMRMRIISDFNSMDTNACRNLSYGQGEDYTVIYESTAPYFKVSKTTACTFENLTFTDTSTGAVTSWSWDFGAGAVPATANTKGPHTVYYTTTGNKSVRLLINGTDSLRKNSYVSISSGPAPLIVLKSGTITGCEGRSITLAVRSTNGVSFTPQWQKNGTNLSGKTDTLLVLTNVTQADSGLYSAQLTNGSCVATSSSTKITVYAKPSPSFSENSNTQCYNYNSFVYTNTSTIAQGSISSYLWRLGDGSTASTTNASKKYLAAGTYTVKVIATSNNGCKDSTSKVMTVNYNATPKFTVNDTDQCLSGNSFVFTNNSSIPSGSLTYQWQFGDASTSTSTSPTKNYTARGIYTVKLISTSNLGCKDTFNKPVRVYSQPAVLFGTNSSGQCLKGNSFSFSNLSINTDGSLTYLWNFGNSSTSTSTAPTYKYASSGTYSVKLLATSSYGCKDSYSSNINVYPQANPKFTVNDTDQCLSGNSFTFTNTSSISSGTLSYSWQFGDATTSTSTSPVKSYSSRGTYTVNLITTSNNSCKDTISKPVRVYSQPAVSFLKNGTAQCLKGNGINFTNTSSNTDGSLSYLWDFGNSTNSTLVNPSVKYSGAGNYTIKLIATSAYGCKDSNSQNVTIYPQGTLSFSVNDSDQCTSGNNFIFSNSSAVSSGSITYAWNFGDNNTSTATAPSHAYSFYGTYKVRLIGTTNFNCKDTAYKNVRVYAQPVVSFTVNKTPQCLKGNSFVFTNASSSVDGTMGNKWNFGDGSSSTSVSPTFSYKNAGNYTVKLVVTSSYICSDSSTQSVVVYPKTTVNFSTNDSDQCLSGNNFIFTNKSTISSGTINSYAWYFGDAATSTVFSPSHAYSNYSIYTVSLVTLSNGMCLDTIKKPVRVYAQPVAGFTISPSLEVCLKYNLLTSNSTATSVDGSLTSQWHYGDASNGSGNTTTHSYATAGVYAWKQVVTSTYGCKDSSLKNITVDPMPKPDFTLDKAVHCENETVDFTNSSSISSGSMTYLWDFGQGSTATTTNATFTYPNFGNYNVLLQATSNKNCKDSAYHIASIASIPIEKLLSKPIRGCADQTEFTFTDSSQNPDATALKHYWDYADGSKDSGMVVKHKYATAGTFKVVLTSKSPYCQASATYDQVVDPRVTAIFSTEIINPETRRFIATDTIIKGYEYQWFFEDGKSAKGNPATHTYPSNSKFDVALRVSNSIGCSDSLGQKVSINSPNYKDQNNSLNFYVYPNPTNQSFTYKFEVKEKRTVEIKLYDVKGQTALYEKIWQDVDAGVYYETVNLKALGFSPGTYPFVIVSGSDKATVKIIYTGK